MMSARHVFSTVPGRFPKKNAAALAAGILKSERRKLPVNIIFSDDITLADLNSRFRKKNRPTDVLSFPADPDMGILGDIYISVNTAKRQAREYDWSLRDEILRLVCHGVLHLCGYDHHKRVDTVVMRAKEDKYLERYAANR